MDTIVAVLLIVCGIGGLTLLPYLFVRFEANNSNNNRRKS